MGSLNAAKFEFFYVPILKWKQGEQHALRQLKAIDRARLLPLIELQPVSATTKLSLAEALKLAVSKTSVALIKAGGDKHPVAIDTHMMIPTYSSQANLLFAICQRLTKDGLLVWPVLTPEILVDAKANLGRFATYNDVVLRLQKATLLDSQVKELVSLARKAISNAKLRLHVVIDLRATVGENSAALATATIPYLGAALAAEGVHTVTLTGGGFPINLMGIPKGISEIERVEWSVWHKARKRLGDSALKFGDYTVTNPKLQEDLDPTKINPSAAIRYALDDKWMVLKAGGTRSAAGFGQYNDLCALLVAHPSFAGEGYSYGDDQFIAHSAAGGKTGNLTTWRRDATNHHLVLAARQCSTVLGS